MDPMLGGGEAMYPKPEGPQGKGEGGRVAAGSHSHSYGCQATETACGLAGSGAGDQGPGSLRPKVMVVGGGRGATAGNYSVKQQLLRVLLNLPHSVLCTQCPLLPQFPPTWKQRVQGLPFMPAPPREGPAPSVSR